MASRIIIHTGLHKTGSSSLQQTLFNAAEQLELQGYSIPKLSIGRKARLNTHSQLPVEMARQIKGQGEGEHWRLLDKLVKESDADIILSSERFSQYLINKRFADGLIAHCSRLGRRVTFVSVIRDHPDWLNSLYSQLAKRLMTVEDFPTFARSSFDLPQFNMVRLHRHMMGRDECDFIAVPFSKNFIADFFAALGISMAGWPADWLSTHVNSNPGPRVVHVGVEIAQAIQAQRSRAPNSSKKHHRIRKDSELIELFRRYYTEQKWECGRFSGLTSELAAEITRNFDTSCNKFARQVWKKRWNRIFPRTSFQLSEFDPATESAETLRANRDVLKSVLEYAAD